METEPVVRVGILQDTEISFVLCSEYVCLGDPVTGEHSISLQDGKIEWRENHYNELLFEPKNEKASFILKGVTIGVHFHWQRKENQEFRGALQLKVIDGQIIVINRIAVEDYLLSVISSEMSAKASLELLKAHAVISRSWLISNIRKSKEPKKAINSPYSTLHSPLIKWYDREEHQHFDVCADDHCQRYQGITRASENWETVKRAVNETRGEVLMYDGTICDARFSKCCGGITEEFHNVWENVEYPYLVKLLDNLPASDFPDLRIESEAEKWIQNSPEAFCNTQDPKILEQILNNYDRETTDFYRWQVHYSQEELSTLIRERSGIDFGLVEELIPVERGTSGRLIRLKIVGTKQTMIIGKELEIRRILSASHLFSSAFTVEKKDGSFVLTGAGWGHGVGLCQIGAAVMGEKGYSYEQILLHYYGAKKQRLY
ncbi:amidase [Bacteroidia bacterium]|nr:amidase [Bacteroidia bacterium]